MAVDTHNCQWIYQRRVKDIADGAMLDLYECPCGRQKLLRVVQPE